MKLRLLKLEMGNLTAKQRAQRQRVAKKWRCGRAPADDLIHALARRESKGTRAAPLLRPETDGVPLPGYTEILIKRNGNYGLLAVHVPPRTQTAAVWL